jgi:hypothetical protein
MEITYNYISKNIYIFFNNVIEQGSFCSLIKSLCIKESDWY